MALYSQFSYKSETYAGAPASVAPPVETPLHITAWVERPGGCYSGPLLEGQIVTLWAICSRAKIPVDPVSLAVLIKDPSGDVTRYDFGADAQPIKTEVGYYYLQLYLAEGGEFAYRWEAGAGAAQDVFEVEESVFV